MIEKHMAAEMIKEVLKIYFVDTYLTGSEQKQRGTHY